jgi:hypothetical protein
MFRKPQYGDRELKPHPILQNGWFRHPKTYSGTAEERASQYK